MSATAPSTAVPTGGAGARRLPPWWPLAALIALAAVLRLSTLDLQSFWYDEAYTPVHVLHADLGATLRSMVREGQIVSAETERIFAAAKADIDQQVARAKEALREQVSALAVSGAEKILRREVNPETHAELLGRLKKEI